jgi:hypothetical protein
MPDDTDSELRRLQAGELDPGCFRHRDHIRLGFEMLRRHPFTDAAHRFACGLKTMAAGAGRPDAYHETITVAFLAVIGERAARTDYPDFPAFARANPDLLEKSILQRWYPGARLASDVARRTFILPDPCP